MSDTPLYALNVPPPPKQETDALRVAMREMMVLDNCFSGTCYEAGPNVFTATPVDSWDNLAYEFACRLPGQWWVSDSGITWVNGRVAARFMSAQSAGDTLLAQRVAGELGIIGTTETVTNLAYWSQGSIARNLLRWVIPDEKIPANATRLMQDIEDKGGASGYHECYPGTPDMYPYCEHWDVSAYYFTMAERSPSLKVQVTRDGTLDFIPMRPSQAARYKELMQVLYPQKSLRNMLVGCALGAKEVGFYTSDKKGGAYEVVRDVDGGEFRGWGSLIVRSGWEMSRRVAQEMPCLYANMDAIITPAYTSKNTWVKCGFDVEREDVGDTHIITRGWYRVGGKATKHYKNALERGALARALPREQHPFDPVPVEVYRQWLL